MKQQPTAAQLAVFHGLQSAGLAGVISALVAILQYLSTGNIDLKTLLSVLGAAFFGALAMMYKSISSNPQLAQAALDTANEAIARIEQMTPAWLNQDIQKIQQSRGNVPKPIILTAPPAMQAAQPPANMPVDYYSRYAANLATQNMPVPPAMPPDPSRGG